MTNGGTAIIRGIASLILLALLSACGGEDTGQAGKRRHARPAHLVETITARIRPVSLHTTRTGTLRAARRVRIYNQEAGRVMALPFHPGDQVRKGDVLLRLDDALLRAQLDKATANLNQARLNLSRIQRLVRRRLSSDDELTRARTALTVARAEVQLLRTRLGYTVARAPFAGVISERLLEPGDIAPQYTHILTLIDPGSLITEVDVSELMLDHFRPGDPVSVQIDALGRRRWRGRILRIHPVIDPRTRQGRIEIRLDPVPPGARSGQLCRVRLGTRALQQITVPFTALRRDEQGLYVFVAKQGRVERRTVITGMRIADHVAIVSGLRDGERVVVRGFLGLRPGMRVNMADNGKR